MGQGGRGGRVGWQGQHVVAGHLVAQFVGKRACAPVVFAKGDGFDGHDGRHVRFGQGDDGVVAKEARGVRGSHGKQQYSK